MPSKRRVAVVFIHGLAKKPHPDTLTGLWLTGLSRDNPRPDVFAPPNQGINLKVGVPYHFNYYADVFYGTEYDTDIESYYESDSGSQENEIAAERLDRVEPELASPQPVTPREAEFLAAFERHLGAEPALLPGSLTAGPGQEVAGFLPDSVRRAVIKKAAMEAYYFLFNKEYLRADGERFDVRVELRRRLLEQLGKAGDAAERTVIISHSMGTMVAYDVLRNCADCPPVSTLITLGSPLGVAEVQAELKAPGTAHVDFPERVQDAWINIYDPLDPICGADPRFANDYLPANGKTVLDVKESNWGQWRHSIVHYLSGARFRQHLRDALEAH